MSFTPCRSDRVSGRHAFIAARTALAAAAIFVSVLAVTRSAHGQRKPTEPDFSRGALYGTVIDMATGKPLADATVAIIGPDGKAITWTKTNAEGKYAVAADTYNVLHLRPSHRRTLLEDACRSVGNVAMAPVRIVAGAVSRPGETVKSAVEATVLGNPAPLATQVANGFTDKAKTTPANADRGTRMAVCNEIFSERQAARKAKKPGQRPGELSIAVSAPGYKEMKGPAGTFWMEPAVEDKSKPKMGVQAWIETVKLAPAAAPADKKSEVAQEALLLADPVMTPALAPAGSTVHISVHLKNPVGFEPKVRIFAREKKKDTVAELVVKDPKTPDLYSGDMILDKGLQIGETQIAIGVLRTEPLEVKIPKAKEDPLLKFASRLDDLEAGKPFEFDPRIFACENRMDMTITVLDAKQGAASSAGAPIPSPPGAKPAAPPAAAPAAAPPVPSPPGAKPPPVAAPPGAKPPAPPAPAPPAPATKPPAPVASGTPVSWRAGSALSLAMSIKRFPF